MMKNVGRALFTGALGLAWGLTTGAVAAPETDSELGLQLMAAARCGARSEVIRLVESGAPVDFKDASRETSDESRPGGTALIYAAFQGDLELTKWLLDHKANPNAVDDDGETPLSSAIRSGEIDIVSALLAHGSDLKLAGSHHKSQQYPLILIAARGDHSDILDLLLKRGANINEIGWVRQSNTPTTPLAQASANAGPFMVKHLLDLGADPNLEPKAKGGEGATPLTAAVAAKKPRNLELLLSRGADPNRPGYDFMLGSRSLPLVVAVSERNLDEIQQILNAHPSTDAIREALTRAKNNWNGVQPEDAVIIELLEKAVSKR